MDEPPATPAAPTVSAGANATSLNVAWEEPANAGPAISDYDVQYSTAEDGPWEAHDHDGSDMQTSIENLERATDYWVRVRATNDEGTSDWSEPASGQTSGNSMPIFTDGETTDRELPENSPEETDVGDPIAATDSDSDPIAFTITGSNPTGFTIDETSGQIKAGDHDYDHETKLKPR